MIYIWQLNLRNTLAVEYWCFKSNFKTVVNEVLKASSKAEEGRGRGRGRGRGERKRRKRKRKRKSKRKRKRKRSCKRYMQVFGSSQKT